MTRKKISVNLQPQVDQMLVELCESMDLKQSEVVQDAIKLLRFVRSEIDQGRKVFTVDVEGKDSKELVLL